MPYIKIVKPFNVHGVKRQKGEILFIKDAGEAARLTSERVFCNGELTRPARAVAYTPPEPEPEPKPKKKPAKKPAKKATK